MMTRSEAAAAAGIRQLELAALPTGKEWNYWWRERSRFVEMTYGWERAMVDAITRLIRNNLTLARMTRLEGEGKKMIRYDSDGAVRGEEIRSPQDITREAFAWFLQSVKPAERDAPEWAKIVFKGLEGCYLQQARLGIELTAIKRRGYLTVNASATKRVPSEREIRDKGMEAFSAFKATDSENL
jgi:hypothetical protein